ncbi:MAG: Rpn family recombination-promoting nuclease/putative transposase [Bacteroidales bacterium]|nr:Rpn family recombination-promoting nuclease/putative transposase [Bacteroidales bacterium]
MCKEKFINPFTGFGFKRLFGSEANKDILINFLNSVIEDEEIVEITYLNVEKLGQIESDRKAIYDLYCKTEKGHHIIVEMQKAWQVHFIDRTIFYSARAIDDAAKKGDWDFALPKIYVIALLNFTPSEFADEPGYKHILRLCDISTGQEFSRKLNYIFLEIKKFDKSIDELESLTDKWMHVIKNLDNFESYPTVLQEKIFKKFFEEARISAFTPEEQFAYEESLKVMRDNNNVLASAEIKGRKEGHEEEKIRFARELKALNVSIDKISQASGLTIEEIEKL